MPALIVFTPCRHVVVDEMTGEVSVIGMLDSIQPAAAWLNSNKEVTGILLDPFAFLTTWVLVDGEDPAPFRQRIVLIDPDGRELLPGETDVDIERGVHNVITTVKGQKLPKPGVYRFRLEANHEGEWKPYATIPVAVLPPDDELPIAAIRQPASD